MHKLEFRSAHKYGHNRLGITVPVELRRAGSMVSFDAKLDTGAEVCLFEHAYGEMLGIDVLSGERLELSTVNSRVLAFGHEVQLTAMGVTVDVMAYFYESPEIHRSVLGRQGWLLKTRLAIVDYDQMLYLSPYDE